MTPSVFEKRERLFTRHEKGIITATETQIAFVDLLTEASNDAEALELCESLPTWFQRKFSDWLRSMEGTDHRFMVIRFNDLRTAEEIEAVTRRRQDLLNRLAPKILATLDASTV